MELMGTSFLIILLTGTITFSFIALLKAIDDQIARAQARASLHIALEEMVVDLHHAFQSLVLPFQFTIRFEVNEPTGRKFYVYYFRREDTGVCAPPFDANAFYELWRAPLTGGLGGTFVCGDGFPTIRRIVPPPTTSITQFARLLTLDFTVKVKTNVIRQITSIRMRNML